jgi:hypothetical protein
MHIVTMCISLLATSLRVACLVTITSPATAVMHENQTGKMPQRALDIFKHRFDLALFLLRLFSLRFASSLTIGPCHTPRTVHSVIHDDAWSPCSRGEYASFHVQLDGCCGSAHASATVLRLKTQVGWDMSITTMQLVGI